MNYDQRLFGTALERLLVIITTLILVEIQMSPRRTMAEIVQDMSEEKAKLFERT